MNLTELEALRAKFNEEIYKLNLDVATKENEIHAEEESMYPFFLVFGIILLVLAAFLIVTIIIQSNKADKGLSGAIAGGSQETFFGKNKGKDTNKVLLILTIVAISLFIASVIAVFVLQIDLSDLQAALSELQQKLAQARNNLSSVNQQISSLLGTGTGTGSGGNGLIDDPTLGTGTGSGSAGSGLVTDPTLGTSSGVDSGLVTDPIS